MRAARGFIDGEYQDGELRGLGLLAGQRGMGKTTEMVRLLQQCSGGCIFFDTTGKHGDLLLGFRTVSQPGELKDYLRANLKRRFRVRYEPRDEFADEHFRLICLVVRAVGSMIFTVDEVDYFCGPHHGPKGMPEELYNLAHFGRHYKVSMLATARDPASLSIRFRSQCESMRIFRTDEERYVKYFEQRIGKANASKLPTLAKFQYLFWQSGSPEAQICGGPRKL